MAEALPAGARCASHPDVAAHGVCKRCGDYVCVECAVLLADGTYCARCAPHAGEPFPWERRKEIGVARAAWATIGAVLFATRDAFSGGFRERSSLSAIAFGMALSVPFEIASSWIARAASPHSGPAAELFGTHALIATLASPLKYLLSLGIATGAWWTGLYVVRGAKRPLGHTLRVIAYVGGVTAPLGLLALVPGRAGSSLAVVASALTLVIQARAMRALHRIELWRVVAALLVGGTLLVALLTPVILLLQSTFASAF